MSTVTEKKSPRARKPRQPAETPADDAGMWPYWVSDPPRLTGNPTPFWEHYDPTGDPWRGDQCARFAHKTGHPLFGWQWQAERKILSTRPDGLWTHQDVCLIVTRQQGKTEIIAWRILYGLFYLGETIVYSAQRWKTVEDVYDRLIEIIGSRPSLLRRLQPVYGCPDGYSKSGNHGEIHTTNGGSLDMGPRTKAVGRGQTKVDLAIFDEAYDIKDTHTTDLTGAQNASNNPQTIFISTAPVADLHPNCSVLAGMRRNGLRGAPDLYAAEFRAPDGLERGDPETWRLAQPSHGVTVRARFVGSEYRRARTAKLRAIFDADYLGWGVWPPDEADAEPKITREAWEALVDHSPLLVGDTCLAIDRTMDSRLWAITAGRRTLDGRVHLELGYYRAAHIGQVAAALVELIDLWDPAAIIVDDRSKAKPIVNVMKRLGYEITVATTPKLAAYTQGFIDAVMAADITHVGQEILDRNIEWAATRQLPRGDEIWDEVESGGPIAPLKALTLVHGAVLEFAEDTPPAAAPVGADEEPPYRAGSDDDIVDLDTDTGASVMGVAF